MTVTAVLVSFFLASVHQMIDNADERVADSDATDCAEYSEITLKALDAFGDKVKANDREGEPRRKSKKRAKRPFGVLLYKAGHRRTYGRSAHTDKGGHKYQNKYIIHILCVLPSSKMQEYYITAKSKKSREKFLDKVLVGFNEARDHRTLASPTSAERLAHLYRQGRKIAFFCSDDVVVAASAVVRECRENSARERDAVVYELAE